jgi:trans-aconitate methyltransferase
MKMMILFVSAVAVPLLVSEGYDWLPYLARWLTRQAARVLPPEYRRRYIDEWAAELDALPGGKITRLAFAVRVSIKAPKIGAILREIPAHRVKIPEKADIPEIDSTVAHPARMYNYFLGGRDNYEADRVAARRVAAIIPGIQEMARANRAFLGRAVRFAAEQGIRQFLDIGTGLPAPGNTTDVARQIDPDAQVVYVDNDPIVLSHARAMLAKGDPLHTTVIRADLRDPDAILNDPQIRAALDFGQPIAVLLVAVLHFIPDNDDPAAIVHRLMERMAPGSCVVISHGTGDFDPKKAAEAVNTYAQTGAQIVARSKQEIERFFDELELVEPGVVQVPWWHPDTEIPQEAAEVWWYGAVARKS